MTCVVKQGWGLLVLGFGPVSYFMLIIFTHSMENNSIVQFHWGTYPLFWCLFPVCSPFVVEATPMGEALGFCSSFSSIWLRKSWAWILGFTCLSLVWTMLFISLLWCWYVSVWYVLLIYQLVRCIKRLNRSYSPCLIPVGVKPTLCHYKLAYMKNLYSP